MSVEGISSSEVLSVSMYVSEVSACTASEVVVASWVSSIDVVASGIVVVERLSVAGIVMEPSAMAFIIMSNFSCVFCKEAENSFASSSIPSTTLS